MLTRTLDWTKLGIAPSLTRGEVHVWRAGVPSPAQIPESWPALLSGEERENVARKRIPLDARRTLASRACLRLLLAGYLGVAANAVAFATNEAGKPRVAGAHGLPAIEFNVSHSGDWIVLAFARDAPVGVDVECLRPLEYTDLVTQFFAPQERERWATVPAAEHQRTFFAAWTQKEAYVKALGLGLSKGLDSFAVRFGPDGIPGLLWCDTDASSPDRWLIESLDVAPGYACALAAPSTTNALATFTFDYHQNSPRRT